MAGAVVCSTSEPEQVRRRGGGHPRWAPARCWVAALAVAATAAAAPAAANPPPPTPPTAEAGTFAYVANNGTGTVSMIDTSDNSVVNTFSVGQDSAPNGVAVSADGTRVAVANALANTMSLIIPGTVVNAPITVGDTPLDVALNRTGTRAYVTNNEDDDMSVVDIEAFPFSVIANVPVGERPRDVALTLNDTRAYVANRFDGTVSVVDTTDNTVETTIDVGQLPQGVAASPDGTLVYVTNFGDGTVSVIDTASNTVELTLPLGLGPTSSPADVAVSPDGRRVYTANFGARSVSVIDTTSNPPTVLPEVLVGLEPLGLAVTPDGSRVYATSSNDNTVWVIDTVTNTATDTLTGFSNPLGVAIGTRSVGTTETALTLSAEPNGTREGKAGALAHPGLTLRARLTGAGKSLDARDIVFSSRSDALCLKRTDTRGGAACPVPHERTDRACYTATYLGDRVHAAATARFCTKEDDRRAITPSQQD